MNLHLEVLKIKELVIGDTCEDYFASLFWFPFKRTLKCVKGSTGKRLDEQGNSSRRFFIFLKGKFRSVKYSPSICPKPQGCGKPNRPKQRNGRRNACMVGC